MEITSDMTEEAILIELGGRLQRRRLDLGYTQAQLSESAGVSKRTVERIEKGLSTQVGNLIRLLRALDLLDGLDALVSEVGPRPMELLKLRGKQRRRATPRRGAESPGKSWNWGDGS